MADIAYKQIKRLRSLIDEAETSLAAAKELLISLVGDDDSVMASPSDTAAGKVVEGVFDGQTMVAADGKNYPVPANYASKSKLVQGDVLKLAIGDDGRFTYKQIGPIPRKTVIGTLRQQDGNYIVDVNGRDYRVLLASVTYFRAHAGDQISVIVPSDDDTAEWAAIEAAI